MGSYAKKLEEAASRQLRNPWALMAHAWFLMGTRRCISGEREAVSVAELLVRGRLYSVYHKHSKCIYVEREEKEKRARALLYRPLLSR